MGVYTDKIVGYIVDVTKEYDECEVWEHNLWDKYVDDGIDLPKELVNLGFKPYYGKPRPSQNDVMLIHDGMSGEYAKLIYIKSVEYYSDDDSDPSPIVNEALKSAPVPDDIRETMQKIYSMIFNSDKQIEVYLQEFTHWH